jgi:DNA-binding CsgD family transcriptional regulator
MAKKDTQAVPSARQSAQRQALKLLRRLGGLYSAMGYWYDPNTNRYIPWDTEVMRNIPSFGMDRDDNAAMVQYVASLGFSGHALSLARAIQRVYAFEDDKRLWPARSDKEGWKEMQAWVDHLRYHASVVAARCTTIQRLIKKTMPKTNLNKRGGKDAVKRRGGGRKRKPSVDRPLTEKQTEAVQIVGESKGDIAAAARRLGRNPKTIRQHYNAAMGKMGKTVVKHATQRLPSDRRGQANIAHVQDRR